MPIAEPHIPVTPGSGAVVGAGGVVGAGVDVGACVHVGRGTGLEVGVGLGTVVATGTVGGTVGITVGVGPTGVAVGSPVLDVGAAPVAVGAAAVAVGAAVVAVGAAATGGRDAMGSSTVTVVLAIRVPMVGVAPTRNPLEDTTAESACGPATAWAGMVTTVLKPPCLEARTAGMPTAEPSHRSWTETRYGNATPATGMDAPATAVPLTVSVGPAA
jgi:hypothetical protein